MWYMTIEPRRASVLHIGVRELVRTKWPRQCCTGPAFVRVLIFLISHENLTLTMTSHGLPRGTGVSGYLVYP
jgi:hypothetical protein